MQLVMKIQESTEAMAAALSRPNPSMPRRQHNPEIADAIAQYAKMCKHPFLFETWPEEVLDPKFLALIQVPLPPPTPVICVIADQMMSVCMRERERPRWRVYYQMQLEVY
jgi:hypothetical protein